MTGYGWAKGSSSKLEISVEIKSVNNRFLDCGVKLPRLYSFTEDKIKTLVQSSVLRGKVDVFVGIDSSKADDVTIQLNSPLLGAYAQAFKQMNVEYGIAGEMTVSDYSRISDIFIVEKKEIDAETFTNDLTAIASEALTSFNTMREREGSKLSTDIGAKLDEMERLRGLIAERVQDVLMS